MSQIVAHKKRMLQALEKSLGVVTDAAKAAKIDRRTHYRWLNDDPEYKEAVSSIDDLVLDFAESQLHKQIRNGEVTSTIFYLKTKGKRRGYIEKMEQDINFKGNITVIMEDAKDCEPIPGEENAGL